MYTYLMAIMLFCVGIVVTLISIPMMMQLLEDSNLVRPNFRGDMIPVGMGIAFLPAFAVNGFILTYFNVESESLLKIMLFMFGLISMSFVGMMDDSIGNRDVTGLKGHFKSLFRGRLTTGGFKAVFGGFVGLIISAACTDSLLHLVIGTLVIALSTNFINLLDLRPGRAIKVFLIISVVMLIFAKNFNREIYMILFPAVLAYFYYDLKAFSMMGDTGSNVLGVAIGIFMVISFSIRVQVAWLVFLIIMHVITEKFSLTKIIEKNRVLNYLDKLGR